MCPAVLPLQACAAMLTLPFMTPCHRSPWRCSCALHLPLRSCSYCCTISAANMLSNIRQESCGNPADSVREGSGCCQQAAPKLLPVGIHTYTDVSVDGVDETLTFWQQQSQCLPGVKLTNDMETQFYTADELAGIEAAADMLQKAAQTGRLPRQCFHQSLGQGGGLKRTKFWFGARCACCTFNVALFW